MSLIYSKYSKKSEEFGPDNSHISGNIWMGAVPLDVSDPGFDFIVSTYTKMDFFTHPHQLCIKINMEDDDYLPPLKRLEHIVDIAHDFASKGKTLIHCHAGLNRSGLVTALVLIRQGMTPAEAIKLIRHRRWHQALNNETFVRHIMSHAK